MSELADLDQIAPEPERQDYSWEEVAERGHLCPSSPGWAGPHIPDGEGACAECGASLEPPRDGDRCIAAGDHLKSQRHRWQECPVYHDDEQEN